MAPFLTACPRNVSTSLMEGSTPDSLRFDISNLDGGAEKGEVYRFQVGEFGGAGGPGSVTVLWEIALAEGGDPELSEIQYGVVPGGFTTVVEPQALVAGGRFFASAGGQGVEFRVSPDGVLTRFDPAAAPDPYAQAGLSADQAASFLGRLQAALGSGDADSLATLVHLPLQVEAEDSTWLIQDRAGLLERRAELFTPDFREGLAVFTLDDLEVTWKGLLASSGRRWIWIGAICGPDNRPPCRPALYAVTFLPPAPD